MITLVTRGPRSEALADAITRGIAAERRDWHHPGEVKLTAPDEDRGKVIDWFCEEGSSLLWYAVEPLSAAMEITNAR